MKSKHRHSVIPVVWFPIALAQQFLLWMLLPGTEFAFGGGIRALGVVLLGVGIVAAVRTARLDPACRGKSHTWSSHPTYLAMLFGLVGSALVAANLTAIMPVAGFASLVSTQFVYWDEQVQLRRVATTVRR